MNSEPVIALLSNANHDPIGATLRVLAHLEQERVTGTSEMYVYGLLALSRAIEATQRDFAYGLVDYVAENLNPLAGARTGIIMRAAQSQSWRDVAELIRGTKDGGGHRLVEWLLTSRNEDEFRLGGLFLLGTELKDATGDVRTEQVLCTLATRMTGKVQVRDWLRRVAGSSRLSRLGTLVGCTRSTNTVATRDRRGATQRRWRHERPGQPEYVSGSAAA